MLSETTHRANGAPPLTKPNERGSIMASDNLSQHLMTSKPCRGCGETKPLSEYSFDKRNNRYISQCKPCRSLISADYVRRNPEKVRVSSGETRRKNPEVYRRKAQRWVEKNRDKARAINRLSARKRLLNSLNMTIEDLLLAYERQLGGCAICQIKIDLNGGKSVHIDHCHKTNRFRGILCIGCNTSLGKFGEDPDLLMRAADYLRGEIIKV